MKTKTIKIKAPFYGAGSEREYGWAKDGFNIFGIGVKIEDIREHEKLKIVLDGKTYTVETQKIKDFVNKYHSLRYIKNSLVRVGVFSTSLLEGKTPFLLKTQAQNVREFNEKWGSKPKTELKKLF